MNINMDDKVIIERRGGVSYITLNRPEVRNAIDWETREQLIEALVEADAEEGSGVIVLSGAGKGFCAGGDANALGKNNEFGTRGRVQTRGKVLVETIARLEKPLIARINGDAVGLGATLALLADITIMVEDARIGDPHVKIGLVAGDGSVAVWPELVGLNVAKRYLLTGELLNGSEAGGIGLVTHSVDESELDAKVESYVQRFNSLPPYALRATKVALNKRLEREVVHSIDLSLAYEHLSMAKEDHAEAVQAFQEKRVGRFSGR